MVKCILCQDEEILNDKARAFVCAAFVQKLYHLIDFIIILLDLTSSLNQQKPGRHN